MSAVSGVMPRPTCMVHIGAPKTGTTYLQRTLAENREYLLTQGWLYPEVSLRGWGHHDLAFLLAGGYPDWAVAQPRSLNELERDLSTAATSCGSLLLSSENFYLLPRPHELRALLERAGIAKSHQIKLVVYLREQCAAHESWYNQTIKAQGYTHAPDQCVADFKDLWDYQRQLSSWSSAFGDDALIVRLYEPSSLVGGDLLSDFCQVIGIDAGQLHASAEPVNTGINRDALEFQRLINALPLPAVQKRAYHRELIELSKLSRGQQLFDESPSITSELRAEIRAYYASGNAEVARRFFARADLFELHALPDAVAPYPGLSSEAMTRLFAWLSLRGKGI